MNRQVLLGAMHRTRFLADVSEEHLNRLADLAELREYGEGEIIFRQGDPVDCVYLALDGEIALEVSSPGVGPQHLLTINGGESIGWSALTHRKSRAATARATLRTRTLRFNGDQVQALCDDCPRFGYQIMRATVSAIATRLRALQLRFFDIYRLQPAGFTSGSEEVGID